LAFGNVVDKRPRNERPSERIGGSLSQARYARTERELAAEIVGRVLRQFPENRQF